MEVEEHHSASEMGTLPAYRYLFLLVCTYRLSSVYFVGFEIRIMFMWQNNILA